MIAALGAPIGTVGAPDSGRYAYARILKKCGDMFCHKPLSGKQLLDISGCQTMRDMHRIDPYRFLNFSAVLGTESGARVSVPKPVL